jgi:hypothetical protein
MPQVAKRIVVAAKIQVLDVSKTLIPESFCHQVLSKAA